MAQQNNNAPLIKPNQVDGLPIFSAETKAHYKNGLSQLWQTLHSSPPGSHEHMDAEQKIRAASVKIMQQISRGGKPNPAPGQRPPSQQGGGQGGMPPGMTAMQQGRQQQQQAAQSQQTSQQAGQQQGGLSQAIRQELANVKINYPPEVIQQGEAAMSQHKTKWYRAGAQVLQRREAARARGSQLQQQTRSGHGNPTQLQAEMQRCVAEVREAQGQWDQYKAENHNRGLAQAQEMQRQHSAQGQQHQQMNGVGQQEMQRPGTMHGVNGAQQQQGDVKMNMDQRGTSLSPQQPQGGFQQQSQQSQNHVAPSPATQNMSQQPPSSHPQQTPQTATQQQPPQNFPPQQKMPQQQQRPPMNLQQAQQMTHQNMNQPQNPPQSAMPQSATQQQPPGQQQQPQQRPQPLTHQAAMSQAAQSYSREQAQQQQHPQSQQNIPQVPNGAAASFNGPPSATQTQTPSSAYPGGALQQQNSGASVTTKFPIPKQLQLDPRTQLPVPGPASRPTFSNAGMMAQPGVQRPSQFTLEGEGDRVLSKRKLDELVRQVTGTASSDSSADSGLTPEVEEAVLTLADDFVDNVITSACRLAKLRTSQTLDMRDVQMVLERNYGIRIPGYGLDEVRTVRKFQPAPGWQSKMQAVQAGKVMGGVGKGDS